MIYGGYGEKMLGGLPTRQFSLKEKVHRHNNAKKYGGIKVMFVLIWGLLVVFVSVWAKNWGRKASNYFWLSFFLSPLVGALVLLIKGKDDSSITQQRISSKEMKRCPYCHELILYEAAVCKFCGKTLEQNNSYSVSVSSSYNSTQSSEPHFYSFETLDDDKKSITNEYINKVLDCNDLGKVLEIQNPYFRTSSLEYIKSLLPDANDFKDFASYKNKIEEAKAKLNGAPVEVKTENKEETETYDSLEKKLTELKTLYDKGLINEEDYKNKKNQILGIK